VKLAAHTMATPELSVRAALELFARLRFDGAELIWQDDYPCGLSERSDRRRLKETRSVVEGLGLGVACLVPYVTEINSLDQPARDRALERFRRCIDAAAVLGCRRVRVYAGELLPGDREQIAEKRASLLESLVSMQRWALDADVILCVENHFNTMAVSAAETVDLLADVAATAGTRRGLGALYDQANLTFTHSESPALALELQTGWIEHVHVKDLVFIHENRPFVAQSVAAVDSEVRTVRSRVVGEGIIDWSAITRGLAKAGYDRYLSLEYEYRWHPHDLPPAEIGLKRSAAHLRQMLDGTHDGDLPA
jgi:L-ribulose-5-phosphate 3-epimerase